MTTAIKTVCVFCGSSMGRLPVYREMAVAMGTHLAEQGIDLIYGGGRVGLMGTVADAVLDAGGKVIGVIPTFLADREVAHPGLTALHVVDTMHVRKAMMAERADAFIAMPGGYGTFEEFCEILTWAQLGLHTKPHGLLNVQGYYDPLIRMFDHAVAEGFLSSTLREVVLQSDSPEALLKAMRAYQPPPDLMKWKTPAPEVQI